MPEFARRIGSGVDARYLHELLGDVVAHKEAGALAQAEQILLSLQQLGELLVLFAALVRKRQVYSLGKHLDVANKGPSPFLFRLVDDRGFLV